MISTKAFPLILFAGISLLFAGTNSDLNVGNRHSKIYAPSNYNKPALVISMHGIGGGSWWTPGAMQYEAIADTANFIVAYPDGENSQWDLGNTMSNKDVIFVLAIIDSMANRYNIDRDRVYASGFSMGGMFSWMLSCVIPDKIAAIVPGNGYPLYGMSGCSEARHVPAMQIHGNADDFVSYSGFVNSFMPSQLSRYGCPTTPQQTKPYPVGVNGRNADQLARTSKSFLDEYGPCEKDGLTSEISLLTADGMIHDWATPNKLNTNDDPKYPGYTGLPFDVNGTWEAWNFMRKHSLKGSTEPIVVIPTHRDTVFNGGFDQSSTGWTLNTWNGTGSGSVINGEYRIEVSSVGTNNSGIQLIQNGIILVQGKSYEVSFDAYASANRTLETNVELDVSPWTSYLPALMYFDLTTSKQKFTYSFTMANATDSNGRIAFNVGTNATTLFLDNIAIREIDTPPTNSSNAISQNFSAHSGKSGSTFHLELNGVSDPNMTIQILNLLGKPILTSQVRANAHGSVQWNQDVSGFSRGIYLIQVKSRTQVLYQTKLSHY